MKKIIINENQRGLLFKNGKYVKTLTAGKYRTFGGKTVEIMELDTLIMPKNCSVETLLADANIKKDISVVEVGDTEIALHFVNGIFSGILTRGKYAFWNVNDSHEYRITDISAPEVDEDFPSYAFDKIPRYFYQRVEVREYEKGLLFFDNKFERILEPGVYYFWTYRTDVGVTHVDTRLITENVMGQEILTRDKVTLRISFVCSYKITDFVKAMIEIDNLREQLHLAVQFALREYAGRYTLDEILQNKDEISDFVFEKLKKTEDELFIEVSAAGIKDIILPGEIRDIMNTVLIAEKRAQANVIARREEVASTRSLLNTAKLMEENQTLYRLKELEYLERICENVGSINLHGGADVLSRLAGLLRGENK